MATAQTSMETRQSRSAHRAAHDEMQHTNDRVAVVRQMIECCRKGGTLAIMGVYSGLVDKFPLGVAMNKALRLRMGQMHGQKYIPRLFEYWQRGEVDPAFVFSHRMSLAEAPRAYTMFRDKHDDCLKLALRP